MEIFSDITDAWVIFYLLGLDNYFKRYGDEKNLSQKIVDYDDVLPTKHYCNFLFIPTKCTIATWKEICKAETWPKKK